MQVEHKTEKGTVIFELLPEEVSKVKLYNYSRAGIWYGDAEPKGLNAWKKQLPKGFQLIGLTSEVIEDQAKMMVDRVKKMLDGIFPVFGYPNPSYSSDLLEHALDWFKYLMQHLQVY